MTFLARCIVLPGVALTVTLTFMTPANAGGGAFDGPSDLDDPLTTVFGFVKDRSGDPVDDTKVTITMKILNTDLVVQTDAQGHFTAKLFYKPVDPKDLSLACAKDGYRQMAVMPRPPLAVGAPIEVDCVLERE